VSTPVSWDEVAACRERANAELLTFSPEQVLERVVRDGDLFAPAATLAQALPLLG
jgi:DNA primase